MISGPRCQAEGLQRFGGEHGRAVERLVYPHRGEFDQGAVAGLGHGAPGWIALGYSGEVARHFGRDGPVLLEPGAAGVEPFDVGDTEAGAEAAVGGDRGVFEFDPETEPLGAAFGDRRERGALGLGERRCLGGLAASIRSKDCLKISASSAWWPSLRSSWAIRDRATKSSSRQHPATGSRPSGASTVRRSWRGRP